MEPSFDKKKVEGNSETRKRKCIKPESEPEFTFLEIPALELSNRF